MITDSIINLIFDIFNWILETFLPIIDLIPSNWSASSIELIGSGLRFFPKDVWFFIVGNGAFWMALHFTWSVVEWVYKKIPGVD